MAVTGVNSEDRLVQATFAAHLKDLTTSERCCSSACADFF